jgi:hypothetical protein
MTGRLWRDRRAVVAVETALCLPLVTFAFLGGFAVAQGDLTKARLQDAASTDASLLAAGQSPQFVASLGGSESSTCSGSCGSPPAKGSIETVSASLAACAQLLGHEWPCSAQAWAAVP